MSGAPRIPEATVSRLPVYLRALAGFTDDGGSTVSSEELAGRAGVSSAQLRKDLSHLGSYGRRGVGYDVAGLRGCIEERIGLTRRWPVVVVGAGKIGQALAGYAGLGERGFEVVTQAQDWPQVEVAVKGFLINRPGILIR